MISEVKLKNAEFVVRTLMAAILLTAGTSKFFSGGGFAEYYAGAFQGDLRIVVPAPLISLYLNIIPYLEVSLGALLLFARLKPFTIYAWFAFMLSLLVGHYILQEWSEVNQMLDYFFLGLLALVLPAHERWTDSIRSMAIK